MCRASEMKSSPRVFSRPFAPQRAAATCSVTRMFNARGHWRSTVALSTQGSCSTARRTAARSTLTSPMSRTRAFTACSTSPGDTRWKRPVTDTCAMFWSSALKESVVAMPSTASTAAAIPKRATSAPGKRKPLPSLLRRFLGLPHIRPI